MKDHFDPKGRGQTAQERVSVADVHFQDESKGRTGQRSIDGIDFVSKGKFNI